MSDLLDNQPDINSEKHLKNYLSYMMENNGWSVSKESAPRHCQSWDKPFRADLICSKKVDGTAVRFGIELKYAKSRRSGAKLAEGTRQVVEQYAGKSFKCPLTGEFQKVDLFSLCPYYYAENERYSEDDDLGFSSVSFIQGFINRFGVGYVNLNSMRVRARWNSSVGGYIMPLFSRYEEDKYNTMSLKDSSFSYSDCTDYVKNRLDGDFR